MRKRKGFTLVELMVVIAVIATLATVSVIGYRTFVRRETINASVTEADQAAQVIISQVASSNEGQITLYNKDTGNKLASLGEVYFTYENGNLQVNSEYPAGTTTTKDSIVEFDSALRYYFPSIVSLPGTFTMQTGAIYYHHLSVDEIIELFDNHYADIYEPDNPSTPYNINDVAIDIISLDFITLEESGNASGSDSDGIKFSLGQSTLFLTKGETLPVNYYISDGTTISKSDIQYDSSYLSIDIYEDHFDLTGKKVTTQPIYVLFNVGRIRKTLKVKICESGRVIVSIPELINTIYWNNEYQSPNDLSKWSVDGDKVILKSCDSGKEPGIYSATFELSNTEDYCWEDDFSYGVKVVNWRINKIVVDTPYQVVYHNVASQRGSLFGSTLHTAHDMQYDGAIQLPDWDAATVALQDDNILTWQTQTRDLGGLQKAYNKHNDYDYGYANPGQYDAIFTITDTAHYKWADSINTNKTVHWHVYKTQVTKPSIKQEFTEFEYDGNPHYIIKPNTAGNNRSSNAIEGLNNYDSEKINLNGGVDEICETNRNDEYKITVSLDDPSKYEWSDGIDYSQKTEPYVREYRDAATNDFFLYWKITPKPMNIPVNDTFRVDYNGSNHVDKVTEHYVPSSYSDKLELTGVSEDKNVGTYNAYIKIKDNNYCWSYNKTTGVIDESPKTLTWCIDPVNITVPTLKYPTKKYYFTPANFGTDYSGKQVTVELNDVKVTGDNGTNKTISIGDATTKYLTVNGITQKNASSEDYTVTLHLQNPAGIVNVKWNTTDGNLTDDREVKWHLYPYEISVNALGIKQAFTPNYTGTTINPTFTNVPSILTTDASGINAGSNLPAIFTIATNHQSNYVIKEGSNTVTWEINKASLTPSVAIVTGGYVYTGSEIAPEVVFANLQNNEILTKGTDYSLSYKNNTNAGNTASITIALLNTAKTNNYTLNGEQSKTITFTIEKADSSYTKPTAKTGLTYNGSAQTLINAATNVVGGTVNYGLGTETSQPSSWSTTLPTGKEAKTYYVWSKVVGDGNHNDTDASFAVSVTIGKSGISNANTTFGSISDYSYGGDDKTPEPTVTVGGKKLTKTTDFTYDYSSNKNAGTATVTITGTGNYSGTASTTFTINKKSITPSSNPTEYKYTGSAIIPTVKFSGLVNNETLTTDDYSVTSSNNTSVGNNKKATIALKNTTKANNYTLSATELTFNIIKGDSSYTKPTAKTGLTYNGSEQTLISAATNVVGGTVYYGLGTATTAPSSTSWSTNLPTGKNVADYYVWSKVVGDSNHNDTDANYIGKVSISKVNSSYTKPTAKKDLIYNKSAQTLINAATNVVGGTVYYGLGANETSQPTSWSTTLPTGTDVKTYYVWSKVDADNNHNDTAASSTNVVQVSISRKPITIAAENKEMNYGGDIPAFTYTVNGLVNGDQLTGNISYVCKDKSGIDVGTTTSVGTYTIYLSGLSNANYNITFNSGTLTIKPIIIENPSIDTNSKFTFNGSEQTITTYYNKDYVEVSGNTETNAGTHTVKFELKDSINTAWKDGTTADKTIDWKIEKLKVSAPSLKYNKDNGDAYLDGVHYSDYTNSYIEIDTDKSTLHTENKNTHSVYFKLKYPDDTEWEGDNYSSAGGCIAKGSKILMADGTKKAVEKLKVGDLITTFNHDTGEFESQPVVYIFSNKQTKDIVNLRFEDGSKITIIHAHGFFCKETNKYEIISNANYKEYIGKSFYSVESNDYVKLVAAQSSTRRIEFYTIASAYNINCVANGMLNISDDIDGLYNVFEYGDNMKYDSEKKQADIDKYGLISYEMFKDYCTEEEFEVFNGKYVGIAISKGLVDFETISDLASCYSGHSK